jgi:TPR repeat protein
MRTLFIIAVIGMLAASGMAAHVFFGSMDADRRDQELAQYQNRIDALRPAAAGDTKAQVEIAGLYRSGEDYTRNTAKVFKWYSEAANKGRPGAQYAVGAMYAAGEGVKQSYHRAADWYRAAARIGRHRDAQFALGDLFFHGRGVAHSYGTAIDWYRKAAHSGHPVAQHLMGSMYQRGWGVDKDAAEAYKWFSLAAALADQVIAYNPEFDPRAERDALKDKMSRWQIDQAEAAVKALNLNP